MTEAQAWDTLNPARTIRTPDYRHARTALNTYVEALAVTIAAEMPDPEES